MWVHPDAHQGAGRASVSALSLVGPAGSIAAPDRCRHNPSHEPGVAGSMSKASAMSSMATATRRGHEVKNCSMSVPCLDRMRRLRSEVATDARPKRADDLRSEGPRY